MQPEIHLGPLTIQTFGICFAVGFLVAAGIIARRFKELGEPAEWTWEMTFSVMVGGLVGARLDYLVENWSKVSGDLLGNLFSGAGLNWLGWQLPDLACIPLAMVYAIGRVGCQLSGDGDYGVHSSLPWAMAYPKGTVPTDVKVHPTPVYETLTMGLVALLLWQLRDRLTGGRLFALYLVLAGVERFMVEFIRRNDDVALGLTLPQLLSLAMVAFGVVLAARVRRADPQPA